MNANAPTHKRPRWLIALLIGLVLFQVNAALRTLRVPAELATQVRLFPALEFVFGIFWALGAGLLLWAVWQRRPSAMQRSMWFLIGFSIYSLLRLFLFTQADYDRGRMAFLVATAAIGLALLAAGTLRPKIHAMENIHDDGKPQN